MNWDEFEHALAWFKSAPAEWINSGKQNLAAAGEWIWEVLQGDFAEEQSTAQVVTSTVISMIPGVDQICDVRDLVANCKKIHEDTNDTWAWVALVLTLIGLIPTLGSLLKGCLKILFASARKAMYRANKAALESGMWKTTRPYVESGIRDLNKFMARPAVQRAIKAANWLNPYKTIAELLSKTTANLNTAQLLKVLDKLLDMYKRLTAKIVSWVPESLVQKVHAQLALLTSIRNQAQHKIDEVLAPVKNWLDQLARRLEIEADMQYRAIPNSFNFHTFRGVTNDAEEIAEFQHRLPDWVDEGKKLRFKPLVNMPSAENFPATKDLDQYPDLSEESKNSLLRNKFDTFHSLTPRELNEGEVLVRVVDPANLDNSICWMLKSEFDRLKSRSEWRRYFGVKAHWNANGEYVTYTVPKGGLKVWEGPAASQPYEVAGDTTHTLEGGRNQIVLDPSQLDKSFISPRKPTGWGYGGTDEVVSLVGVPTLRNNVPPPRSP